MRRLLALAGLAGLGLGLAWFALSEPVRSEAAEPAPLRPDPRAGLPSSGGSVPPARAAQSVRGTVVDDSGPVPGVTVLATAEAAPEALSSLRCDDSDGRGRPLLQCGCFAAAQRLGDLVSRREGEAPVIGRTVTGADGSFELEGLPHGSLTLWAEPSPRGTGATVHVATGATQVRIALGPGRVLSGKVQTWNGRPLARVPVTAVYNLSSRFFDALTDDGGAFRIGPVPEGEYTLSASREGLLSARADARDASSGDLRLTLRPLRRLAGRVVWSHRPMAGVPVIVSSWAFSATTRSDARGGFEFRGLEGGSAYGLRALHEGRVAAKVVELPNATDQAELVLELEPAGVIEGTVREAGGPPAAGVTVEFEAPPGGRTFVPPATTDAQGNYRLEGVPLGRCWVRAVGRGWQRGDKANAGNVEREVTAGPPLRVDFELERAAVIKGTVVDPDGQPVANVRVRSFAPGTDTSSEERESGDMTAADGSFVFEHLAAGPHVLRARHERFRDVQLTALAPASEVRIVLREGASVSGRVTDETGAAAVGAQVRLLPNVSAARLAARAAQLEGFPEKKAVADRVGRYRISGLEDGDYSVVATSGAGLAGVDRYATRDVEISGQRPATADLVFPAGLTIRGVVLDDRRHPVGGAHVSGRYTPPGPLLTTMSLAELVLEDRRSGRATSREDGAFELAHLAPGTWAVQASIPGGVASAPISAKAGAAGLTLVLPPHGRLRGRVRAPDGRELETCRVNGTSCDDEGRFELASPADPELTLEATADGFSPARRTIAVLAGEDQDLGELVLGMGRTVRLGVTGPAGPVAEAMVQRSFDLEESWDDPPGLVPRTSASGQVRLDGLEDGPARVTIRHPAYARTTVVIPPGVEELTVQLAPGAKIAGVVLRDGSVPVAGASVSAAPLAPLGAAAFSESTRSRSDGTFAFLPGPAGRYEVSMEFRDATGLGVRQTVQAELATGADAHAAFQFQTGAHELVVEVVDGNGKPALARGTLAGPSGLAFLSDQRELSKLRFVGLPAGSYVLSVFTGLGSGADASRGVTVPSALPVTVRVVARP